MPKTNYEQKFRKEWKEKEEYKKWLIEVTADPLKAMCKYCKCSFRAKLSDINNHAKSVKHSIASKDFSCERQTRVEFYLKPKVYPKIISAELRQALFIAEHCSLLTSDHLVLANKSSFEDSETAKKMSLHRTKCSALIKNILYMHFKNDLIDDIGESEFSLLIDESTDLSVTKYLGLAIVYYSASNEKILSTFLSLIELEEANADGIVSAVKKVLSNFNLNLQKLRGIGTDNANVMVGVNNGVYAKLKGEVPSLVLIRCVCHSLQIAVSAAASEMLPRNIEFLISETYNWFSRSPSRITAYRNLYRTLNDGHDPLKIVQSCATRWLSIEGAVSRICSQWIELKLHFSITRSSERCYTAEVLYGMYSDDMNYAYLLYLKSLLVEVQRVNKSFQAENVDSTKLLNDLTLLMLSLVNKITLPTVNIDPFETDIKDFINFKSYLGFETEQALDKKFGNVRSCKEETIFRKRCINFTYTLIQQIKQRFPNNVNILKKMSILSVKDALCGVKESLIPILEEMRIPADVTTKIEHQWNSLSLVNWRNKSDTVSFWTEVRNYSDASGENPFKEVSCFAISMLILPHSNAQIERVFSQLNIVKNKLRNRMGTNMANSLLTIRFALKRKLKSCHDYEFPLNVLQNYGTDIYKSQSSEEESVEQALTNYESFTDANDDIDLLF